MFYVSMYPSNRNGSSDIIHNLSLFLQINASFPGKPINKYSGYVYDGVWLYALALDRLIKEVI